MTITWRLLLQGINQDGMMKNPMTYEIMTPESVGLVTYLVLCKHSGRAAFKQRKGSSAMMSWTR